MKRTDSPEQISGRAAIRKRGNAAVTHIVECVLAELGRKGFRFVLQGPSLFVCHRSPDVISRASALIEKKGEWMNLAELNQLVMDGWQVLEVRFDQRHG